MKTKFTCDLCQCLFDQRNRMILSMLKGFEQLGDDPMARIDARAMHAFHQRKCQRLGIIPPKGKK